MDLGEEPKSRGKMMDTLELTLQGIDYAFTS